MSTKEVIRCQSCGSSTITNLNNGTGICEHCKSTMILPKEKSEIISLLNSAYVYRETYNYDLAIKTYEYAIEKDPQELSAYEGIILSTYGIEYVKDPHTSKLIPTCHRAHFKNVFENEYYKAFLTIANDDQKAALEVKLNEINKLQAAIERQLQNEQEFDVFISYKSNDENGDKTEDSVIAHEIYDELTRKNYKVFFAEKTLENRIGSEYEPIIYKALHTSKIFILVGTKKEYIEACWVRNEWSRFIDRIKSPDETVNTTSFIPVFKGMNPYDMPKVNNQFIQGVDASKIGYVMTVADGVQRLLKPAEEKNVLNTFDNLENFETFQKIQKQKKKELKNNEWKDLHKNPKKKMLKFLYYALLAVPLLIWLATIITLVFPSHFLRINKVVLLSFAFGATTITLIINLCKYYTQIIRQIVIPYAISTLLLICYFLVFAFVPLTISNITADRLSSLRYSNGLYYGEIAINNVTTGIRINNYKSEEYLRKYGYIYEKDGLVYFELPEEIDGKPVKELYFEELPDSVEVLIIPKSLGSTNCSLHYKKTNKLKTIKVNNLSNLEIIDKDDVININNIRTHFNYEYSGNYFHVEVYTTNKYGESINKGGFGFGA